MKTLFILSLSLFCLNILMPGEKPTGDIRVTVTSLASTKGQVLAALYNSSEGFPSNDSKVYRSVSATAEKPKTTLTFKDIPYGTYAIAILHDEDGDGEMDTNLLGIPQEGYGASNNPDAIFSAPTFEEARFELNESEKNLLIHLRN